MYISPGLYFTVATLLLRTAIASGPDATNYYSGTKLNNSTFRIIEADKYSQIPFIYAKVYATTIVLIDTGCGGPTNDEVDSLQAFLETVPIAANDNKPINPSAKPYTIISTHCHFDHIGGMTQFAKSASTTIWASALNKCFSSPHQLPKSSLCDEVGMEVPIYNVTNWSSDGQAITDLNGLDINLKIYHTPGHTPDSLVVWDTVERYLFVGDTLYENAPIYFFAGGSLFSYRNTLARLQTLVGEWNSDSSNSGYKDRVKLAAGHLTSGVDAYDLLTSMIKFMKQVIAGDVTPESRTTFGHETKAYISASGKLSFEGEPDIFDDFLKAQHADL